MTVLIPPHSSDSLWEEDVFFEEPDPQYYRCMSIDKDTSTCFLSPQTQTIKLKEGRIIMCFLFAFNFPVLSLLITEKARDKCT